MNSEYFIKKNLRQRINEKVGRDLEREEQLAKMRREEQAENIDSLIDDLKHVRDVLRGEKTAPLRTELLEKISSFHTEIQQYKEE